MQQLRKVEKTLGSLKFAVIIIILFSLFMIVGTFLESYYGTDFANRLIYKRWPFMLIQLGMFLSIFCAAMLRLPPRKKLYGFYTIHSGLILIGCGSFITYYAGIDGSITLAPNDPNRNIVLNDDIVKITYPEEGLQVTRNLPLHAFETNLGLDYRDIKLIRYLPYAERELEWKKSDIQTDILHSSQYQIANDNVSQDFTLSLHPEARDFKSSLSLGPLNINYMAAPMAQCFGKNSESNLIVWNQKTRTCFTPEEQKISIQTTESGNRFLVIKENEKYYSFFPDFSPWPMDENFQVIRDSHLRIFSKKIFQEKPYLFLFGKQLAYFDKEEKLWSVHDIPENGVAELPWMGFQVRLLNHQVEKYPVHTPKYVMPIQKNSALIKGDLKALEVKVQDKRYWVTDRKPLALLIDGKRVNIEVTKDTVTLPFEFVLKQFKMDKDPGTNNPASYESFVTLFTDKGPEDHHIFMNNPLKYEGFTFYQASYGQTPQGQYVSTLSANVDQGRPIKYLGSILLVLGSILHYFLNKSRYMNKKTHVTVTNSHREAKNQEQDHEMV